MQLKSGSTLAGTITLADSKRVQLETADGTIVIPAPAIGYLKFAHSWGSDLSGLLERKPPGVAYLNRDYAEGEFVGFKDGVATDRVGLLRDTIDPADRNCARSNCRRRR